MIKSPNILLSQLEVDDARLFAPHLEVVPIARGDVLIHARRPIRHVHFLEGGVASMLSGRSGDRRAEVAVIGREGLCGAAGLLMADEPAHEIIVQVDHSRSQRIPIAALLDIVDRSPSVRRLLLRYVQTLVVQIATAAVANLSDRLDARLARWLLMCHDRIDGDMIALTHDFTAMMIGAQRSAVTATLHILESERLIQANRGAIRILSRAGLQQLAQDGYGLAEAEYRRLIAPFGKPAGRAPAASEGRVLQGIVQK